MNGDHDFMQIASTWREFTPESLADLLKTFSLPQLQKLRDGIKPAEDDAAAYKFKAAQIMHLLLCAELAALKPQTEEAFTEALEDARNLLSLQAGIQIEALNQGENISWKELLFALMKEATWGDTIPLPAAMDLVASFLDEPIQPIHRVEFCALVADISRTPMGATQKEGTPAKLIVELMPFPNNLAQLSQVYADPLTMGMTQLAAGFPESIQAAVEWAKEKAGLGLNQTNFAVRWSLTRYSAVGGTKSFFLLEGASAGLAFALAIGKLGAMQMPATDGARTSLMTQLSELTLEGASASAQIRKVGSEWKLLPISSEYEKVVAAFTTTKVLPRIRYVLMAKEQQGLNDLPETEKSKILPCETIAEAVRELHSHKEWHSIRSVVFDQRDLLRQYRSYVPRPKLESELSKLLQQLIQNQNGGYLLLEAPPGFGKTALLVNELRRKEFKCAYHLLRREQEWDNVIFMLRSLIAQLSWLYDFKIDIPTDDANVVKAFNDALRESSAEAEDELVVIFIDGLDEAFGGAGAYHDKKLNDYFPQTMPRNVFFFVSSRNNDPKQQFTNCVSKSIGENEAKEHIPDILEYLKVENSRRGLKLQETFLETLANCSEGCFLAARFYLDKSIDEDDDAYRARLSLWQSESSHIFKGYQGVFSYHWDPIRTAFQNELTPLKEFLGLVAYAKDRVNMNMLFELVNTRDVDNKPMLDLCRLNHGRLNRDYVRHFPFKCRELFVQFDPDRFVDYMRFYHTFFQEKIREEVSEVKKDVLKVLMRFCDRWNENDFEFKEYALRFGLLHHLDNLSPQGACRLLFSDGFAEARLALNLPQENNLLALISQLQSIADLFDTNDTEWTTHLVPGIVQWLKSDRPGVPLLALHTVDSLVYELSQLPEFLNQAADPLAARTTSNDLEERALAFKVCVGLLSDAKRNGSDQLDSFGSAIAAKAAQPLIQSFASNHSEVRLWGLRLANSLGPWLGSNAQYLKDGVSKLFSLLESDDGELRFAGARALNALGDNLAEVPDLKETFLTLMAGDKSVHTRWSVMLVMAGIGDRLKNDRTFVANVKPLMQRAKTDVYWDEKRVIIDEQFAKSLGISL
ncbi:MAG: hypothetical protein KIT45_05000 [Fimbriimonadia bacterium]|nr:hypothetical protein [Fimbriimonadia bacterium]